ncbi:MAG: class I tRNA ligase family protein [Candidatus Eiseniibacteriota bacterium]|jgi:isoleucyl-tRNA synthetase
MFKDVPNTIDFIDQERRILDFWRRERSFERLRELRRDAPRWSFQDGPITANGAMGVHHAWGRTYKDLYHRLRAMQGYQTRYQNGFDCQGLWVEVGVERDLEFKSKRDIEAHGLDRFVTACKQRVLRFAALQTEQSIRLGYWMEWDDPERLRWLAEQLGEDPARTITYEGPAGTVTDSVEGVVGRLGRRELGGSYFTFSEENNFMIWAMLKRCFERGWIYKGTDVMPWCARCGTGISQHEIVTDGYQELTHASIFLHFPLRERAGESLLVWTTTPWTLTSNVGAAVHPEMPYVLVEQAGQRFWLAKGALQNAVRGEHRVVDERPGSALVGWAYDGPFDELEAPRAAGAVERHHVIPWEEVGAEEGTGIVHIAPGCGAEDFALGREHDLPPVAPLDDTGLFIEGFGWLSGERVHDTAPRIFEDLERKGLVHRIEDYTHRYPVCWRCSEELVFRLVDEWFISMGEQLDKPYEEVTEAEKERHLRYQMMEVVRNETTWHPSFGLARELDWLRNMHDWMISKKRYWGLALPIYECEACGHFEVIGSRDELRERAVEGWEAFDGHSPHRPWIDAVRIACPECGATVSRIPDVGNPWLDAGIVGYSTLDYRTDREHWQQWFPADLISESFPGQFRNWFYSLIAMSTVLERRAPFRNVFSYATLLAEDGREMHKSWGNAIAFDQAAEEMGVDVIRWMYCATTPEQNMLFGYGRAREVRRQFLIPLWNVYSFLVTYARVDGWQPETSLWRQGMGEADREVTTLLDRWILSRLQVTVRDVTARFESYEPEQAARLVDTFLDDLSNWYVRRSRRRFWKSEADDDKQIAYRTLYTVMTTLARLLAPCVPCVTEAIYQNLVRGVDTEAPESVHHTSWPEADAGWIDPDLDAVMDATRTVVTLGHAARAGASLKVRQPLAAVRVALPEGMRIDAACRALVLDELNVKAIEFVDAAESLVGYRLQADLRRLGPRFGKRLRDIRAALEGMEATASAAIVREVEAGHAVTLELAGGAIELEPEDIVVRREQGAGLAVASDQGVTVAVETALTPELVAEGRAREVIRRIQALRKEADLELDDRIITRYEASGELAAAIAAWGDTICQETLSVELRAEPPGEGAAVAEDAIDGETLRLGVRRVAVTARQGAP